MRVFRSFQAYHKVLHPVVTIGTFDGVHIGHQRILNRINDQARQIGGESLLLTFWPHPRIVLQGDDTDLKLLNTLDEKIDLLDRYGLDNLLVVPFTHEFSRLKATEFIRDVIVEGIGTKVLVIGYDHRFGRNREGSFDNLQECASVYDYRLEEISAQEIDDVTVSSTKIRHSLRDGEVRKATSYLGHSYTLRGRVVRGDRLGRKLGFPTANLQVKEQYKLIPANGVYLVRVHHGHHTYFGMLNIGHRPTIVENGEKRVEVFIFDFDRDVYGDMLELEFLDWMREDLNFDSLQALKDQLSNDRKQAMEMIRERH